MKYYHFIPSTGEVRAFDVQPGAVISHPAGGDSFTLAHDGLAIILARLREMAGGLPAEEFAARINAMESVEAAIEAFGYALKEDAVVGLEVQVRG